MPRPIRHPLVIGGLLFLSTVINYIDRQTLSVLAPVLKDEFRWTNSDFALVVIAFRVAYAVGQTASGRWLDRVGTRAGLTLAVAFYSVAAMLTSLGSGLRSFMGFRFLLGLGESANWPGATKAVAEWFPRRDSGWAVALFDSGSSIGAALAPFIVLGVYRLTGSWRPAFIVTGILGFLWIPLFRCLYRTPEEHPRLRMSGGTSWRIRGAALCGGRAAVPTLIYRAARSADMGHHRGQRARPIRVFITDCSRSSRERSFCLPTACWRSGPFLAADLGNFAGGGLGALIAPARRPRGSSSSSPARWGCCS